MLWITVRFKDLHIVLFMCVFDKSIMKGWEEYLVDIQIANDIYVQYVD